MKSNLEKMIEELVEKMEEELSKEMERESQTISDNKYLCIAEVRNNLRSLLSKFEWDNWEI